ncbi:FMRFamide receptor-like [Haliotis rufescens]|uniref:FMRFamide receptor-like n=1 Tax=Haliotis rufescens TaxID=6454 RepID=UPI00201F48DD|nr:FMRFamide receptor-like [Haliotis rufescens]
MPDKYLDRVYIYWHYLGGVVCSIISFVGIGGNIVTIIVLSSPEMKSSTSIFLIVLAMFDVCVLINMLIANTRWMLLYSAYSSTYFHYFMLPALPTMYAVTNISHTGSIYTVVAVNFERYIAVCHPLKAASFCTISRAIKTSIAVFIMCLIYTSPRYLEMYLKWDWVPEFNQTMLVVGISDMSYNYWYMTVYLVYINVIVKFVIPGVLLVTLNTVMVRKLYRTKPNLQKQERKGSEKERFTAMVLAVVVVFLVSLAAACLELIMYEVNSAMVLEECSEICGYISGIGQLAVVTNSSINFLLFCFFGRKFRGVFAKKFLSCSRR